LRQECTFEDRGKARTGGIRLHIHNRIFLLIQ
jgi:hypothetical protein